MSDTRAELYNQWLKYLIPHKNFRDPTHLGELVRVKVTPELRQYYEPQCNEDTILIIGENNCKFVVLTNMRYKWFDIKPCVTDKTKPIVVETGVLQKAFNRVLVQENCEAIAQYVRKLIFEKSFDVNIYEI